MHPADAQGLPADTRQEALFNAREALTRAEAYKDTAIIFVRGFQTRFDEASLWLAQIMEDIGFDGAAFLFSWPSKGEFSGSAYNADIDRARNSRKAVIQFSAAPEALAARPCAS